MPRKLLADVVLPPSSNAARVSDAIAVYLGCWNGCGPDEQDVMAEAEGVSRERLLVIVLTQGVLEALGLEGT